MEQFQYLSLSSGSSPRNDDKNGNGLAMPPLSPLSSSPVLKHEHDPFAFEWAVKREVVSHDDSPDADCSTASARSSSLFQSLAAFALPSLPPVAGSVPARTSFDLSSVDGSSDCWSQLASLPLQSSVNKVRFAANPTSVPQFTFDLSSASLSADSSSAPSSPVSRRGSMTASSSSANSRAASPHSPWSGASDYDDDVSSPVSSSSVSGSWSPSSSHSSVNSPSSSSIRSSLSAFRSRTHSVSSSSSSVDDDIVDCDASPDADIDASLSPLADAAAISQPCTIRTSSLKGSKSSVPSSPVLTSMIAPTSVVKPIAKSASSDSKRGIVARKSSTSALVGPTGLPVTPMCSPSACDAIAAASSKSSLREVGRYTLHFVPDCDNPRPPKAKATPLNIYFAPSSGSSSSLVPVRIRLRPQAPRSFRNVVKTARTYTTMHGVAPPADASDKDPSHFLYFSITAIDSQTKLAGPQAAHVAGRGTTASASSSSTSAAACGDRTRRQAKFKHADDKKEYQGHVQLDLSQPGDGARLEVRLYSGAPVSGNGSLPRFHVATSSCDHKFAQMYVADLSSNTSNRV